MIDISNISKGKVLAALYNNSKVQGFGAFHFDPKEMTESEANTLLKDCTYFDYLKGRVMKIDLSGDSFDPYLYDRDNGNGKAERIVSSLR